MNEMLASTFKDFESRLDASIQNIIDLSNVTADEMRMKLARLEEDLNRAESGGVGTGSKPKSHHKDFIVDKLTDKADVQEFRRLLKTAELQLVQ